MIDILNSNKEYSIKVRFDQDGVDSKLILDSLIGCIESGDTLCIDINSPEIQSFLLVAEAKAASDSDAVETVLGLARGERSDWPVNANSINTNDEEIDEYE